MKKFLLLFFVAMPLFAFAQTVNVHLKSGKVVKYTSSEVDYVDFSAKGEDDDPVTPSVKDMTYPVISDKGIIAIPTDCQVFKRGETIPFNYIFMDDTELGYFNIEVHNNFDHHTHSTSSVECQMDEKKTPNEPWTYNQDFAIPAGLQTYTSRVDIHIPSDIDSGDYHFMIRLTDRAGWQQLHAVSIKIQ